MLQIPKRKQWGKVYARIGGAIGVFLLIAVVASMVRNITPKIAHAFNRWHHNYSYKVYGFKSNIKGVKTLQETVVVNSGGTPEVPATQTVKTVEVDAQTAAVPNAADSAASPASSSTYYSHSVVATVFWLGEKPSADNGYITNTETEWDPNPVSHFGGYDDPDNRASNGLPVGFTPKHNPYYFALPVSEHDANGNLRTQSRTLSPWAGESVAANQSLLKGRWIRVQKGTKVVYCQWLDTGPYQESDYNYVYGTAAPKNTLGEKAGLDLSPTAAAALGVGGSATVTWRFATAAEAKAASGLWNNYPAINNINYWD